MDKKIRLYALTTCIHCRNTKEYLKQCGVEFDCVEVDRLEGAERKEVLDQIKQLNADLSFPTLVIGDQVIVGFRKDRIEEALKS